MTAATPVTYPDPFFVSTPEPAVDKAELKNRADRLSRAAAGSTILAGAAAANGLLFSPFASYLLLTVPLLLTGAVVCGVGLISTNRHLEVAAASLEESGLLLTPADLPRKPQLTLISIANQLAQLPLEVRLEHRETWEETLMLFEALALDPNQVKLWCLIQSRKDKIVNAVAAQKEREQAWEQAEVERQQKEKQLEAQARGEALAELFEQ